MARYRLRTWLRERLPWSLAERIPKGRRDCGQHEWYWAGGDRFECYHCQVGMSQGSPWPEAETILRRLEGLHDMASTLGRQAPTEEALAEQRSLVAEMAELLDVDVPTGGEREVALAEGRLKRP